jgi:sulfite oxidase
MDSSSNAPGLRFGRRGFFIGGTGLLAAALNRRLEAASQLIRRVERPPQLESTLSELDPHFTSNDAFFVRSHFSPPTPDLLVPRLDVIGSVVRPLSLDLNKIKEMEMVELPAVLQCSGNGRALHHPRVPGVQWERGAVGHARWRGVRLSTLLERAGLDKSGLFVHLIGADSPPNLKTPAFLRSITIEPWIRTPWWPSR